MMKKIQKALAICMSVTCIAGYSTPALAASTNVNSVGSVVADAAADDQSENNYGSQGIVGKDATQQKESEYSTYANTDKTVENGNAASTDVYATQSSTFSVVAPVVLVMDGSAENETHKAVGQIQVAGNLAGNEYLEVTPQDADTQKDGINFALKQTGKSDVVATIVQDKTKFCTATSGTVADMDNMTKGLTTSLADTTATITVTADDSTKSGDAGISAGSWHGQYNTNIALNVAE